ncbi:hypothetical protein ACVGWL_11805, partial [Enterobacter asburiae]
VDIIASPRLVATHIPTATINHWSVNTFNGANRQNCRKYLYFKKAGNCNAVKPVVNNGGPVGQKIKIT